jgi:ketosteroid isomerase-like protein
MGLGLVTAVFGAATEAEVKALEQQWLDAYMKADTAALGNIEADDWTFIDSDGTVMTKARDIKELGDKTFVCKSATMSDFKSRPLGDNFVLATATVKMSGTYKGKEFDETFRSADLFEKKGGKWQAIYSQVTKIGKDKE